MAQIYVPDNPREREQLHRATTELAATVPAQREQRTHVPRRFSSIDLLVLLALLAALALLVTAAARWAAPLTPAVSIDLAPTVLPLYAGYSLLRMLLAYLLSLLFTLIYGHFAATHQRGATVMVPVLDILQSVPILSFLPTVTLALVAAFPHSNVGLELASIILIFTSQAWNMTFSFYHCSLLLSRGVSLRRLV